MREQPLTAWLKVLDVAAAAKSGARLDPGQLAADIREALSWSPIATAPTDGTRVLVLDDGFVTIARNVNGYDHWTADNGVTVAPSHWRLLPPPRVSRAGATQE